MSLGTDISALDAERVGPGEEVQLWREHQRLGSAASRERLFGYYFGFARSIANRLWRDRNRGDLDLADLSQLACGGLLEAIDHFDAERGVPFRAYAGRRITGSVLDGLAKMTEVREQMSLQHRVRSERTRSLAGDRAPGSTAEALQALIEAAVGLAIGFMLEGTNLYAADDEAPAKTLTNGYESTAWKELVRRLMGEVGVLPERERQVVRLHYLKGLTFEQVGAVTGVTKGRVSQIHRQAMARLRAGLGRQGHFRLER